jgi:hypothetical protein
MLELEISFGCGLSDRADCPTDRSLANLTTMRRGILLLFLFLFTRPLLAGRDVSDVRYGPSELPGNPAIASNGNRFLTLWYMSSQIYGSLSDGSGGSDSPAFPVVPFVNGNTVAVTAAGSGYLAIWNQLPGENFVGTLTADGVVVRRARLAVDQLNAPQLAFNGSRLAVVDFDGVTYLSIYELDGTLVRRNLLPLYGSRWYSLSATGGDFAVAIAAPSGTEEWRVSNEGTIMSKVRIQPPPASPIDWSYAVSSASKSGRTVLAWVYAEETTTLSSATIQPDGTATLHALPDGGARAGRVAVLPVDRGFVVVWNVRTSLDNLEMFALRLDENGALIDTQPISLGDGQFVAAGASGNTIKLVLEPPFYPPPSTRSTVTGVVDATGISMRTATVSLVSPVHQVSPALAANGSGFTAAWLEQDGLSKRVMAARVSPAGDPLDSPGITLGQASNAPVVAHGASEDLIVWAGNEHLLAARLSTSGSVLDPTPLVIAPLRTGSYAVAWNGSRFLIVWSNAIDLLASFVGTDGVLTPPQPLKQTTASPDLISDLDLAWDGRQFMLVFSETTFEGCDCPESPDHVRLMRIAASGLAVDSAPLRITGRYLRGHVATSGTEWLIALDDIFDTSSIVVRDEGGVLHLDAEVPLFHWFRGSGSDVGWDGASYVVALQYNPSLTEAGWLAAVQVSRSGVPLRSTITALAGPPDFTTLRIPSVATDGAGNGGFVVSEMAPPFFVSRARIYLSSEFSAMPAPPPAPRNAVNYFSGSTARIDWESDDGGNGFVLERSSDFGKNWSTDWSIVIPADARTITVYAYVGDLFRVRAFGPGGMSDGPITSIGSLKRRRAQRP